MITVWLFNGDRGQAVRLPREPRLPGDRIGARRTDARVLPEPLVDDLLSWFAAMDRLNGEPFMPGRRDQPSTPEREIVLG